MCEHVHVCVCLRVLWNQCCRAVLVRDVKSNDKTLSLQSLFSYHENEGLHTCTIPLHVQPLSMTQLSILLKIVHLFHLVISSFSDFLNLINLIAFCPQPSALPRHCQNVTDISATEQEKG